MSAARCIVVVKLIQLYLFTNHMICICCLSKIYYIIIYAIFYVVESQPYQEVEHGAMGGNGNEAQGLGQLRLDDDNEFPPMTHKSD